MTDDPPVWLLDVDGVINARRPSWGAAPRQAAAYADGNAWRMRWAPACTRRIRALHLSGRVEIRWCTSWCGNTDQLERLFLLPALPSALTAGEVTFDGNAVLAAKRRAAAAVLDAGRRLVWTDDDAIPPADIERDATVKTRSRLLISPDARRGLQPPHLDAIEAFLTA